MSKTVFEAHNECKKQLMEAGIEDYAFESVQMIKHVTGLDGTAIATNPFKEISPFAQNNLTAMIKQRIIHYPLQYILGEWDFYGRKFFVGPGALIPRQDTETLVETALKLIEYRYAPRVLDLCAGTGCVGITVACERKDAAVLMLEKYDAALYYTHKNIQSLAIKNSAAVKGDVKKGDYNDRRFDLIVSNPPYLTATELRKVQTEVTYEPREALHGGMSGTEYYTAIVKHYVGSLRQGGSICLEVGATQADFVCELLRKRCLEDITVVNDAAGKQRVVFGTFR